MNNRKAQDEFIEELEKLNGTWEEAFWDIFDSKTMSIDEKSERKLKTKGRYKDQTFRRWWCIVYWFVTYAKLNYGFDYIYINEGKCADLRMSHCSSVAWQVWFESNGGKMFVPYVLINQNNPKERFYLR